MSEHEGTPVVAGIVTAVVGSSSSFVVVLAGLTAVGATPAQAASGLLVLLVTQALGMLWLARPAPHPDHARLVDPRRRAAGLHRRRRRRLAGRGRRLRRHRRADRAHRPGARARRPDRPDPGLAGPGDARRRAAAHLPGAGHRAGRLPGVRRSGRARLAGDAPDLPALGGAGLARGRPRSWSSCRPAPRSRRPTWSRPHLDHPALDARGGRQHRDPALHRHDGLAERARRRGDGELRLPGPVARDDDRHRYRHPARRTLRRARDQPRRDHRRHDRRADGRARPEPALDRDRLRVGDATWSWRSRAPP